MKNFVKLLGIIAFVAVIGFAMAACDITEESKPLDALDKTDWTTIDRDSSIRFWYPNGPKGGKNFSMWISGSEVSGNYTLSGNTVTLYPKIYDSDGNLSEGDHPLTGTLSGNTLTFTVSGSTITVSGSTIVFKKYNPNGGDFY